MGPAEELKPNPQETRNSNLWERLRLGLKGANDSSNLKSGSPEQAQDDPQRIEELRGLIAGETQLLPTWAERTVDLDSINFRGLPIGWQALTNLGRVINEMNDEPSGVKDLAEIKPPPSVYPILPMVASVVANRRNPDIPVTLPTEADIKAIKPWLTTVERFIGKVSKKGARKFGNYVEKRGQRVVTDIGSRISTIAEQVQIIEHPKQQFLTELTNLYNQLASPTYETEEGLFGDYRKQVGIEEKIHTLLLSLRHIREGGHHQVYTVDQYPLLNTVIPVIQFPPDALDDEHASVAGAELMDGIRLFLEQRGVANVTSSPKARDVNLLDPGSWTRGIAENFFGGKLRKVKRSFPMILSQVYEILPASGPDLSEKIYGMAEDICILTAQGHSADEIAHRTFT